MDTWAHKPRTWARRNQLQLQVLTWKVTEIHPGRAGQSSMACDPARCHDLRRDLTGRYCELLGMFPRSSSSHMVCVLGLAGWTWRSELKGAAASVPRRALLQSGLGLSPRRTCHQQVSSLGCAGPVSDATPCGGGKWWLWQTEETSVEPTIS